MRPSLLVFGCLFWARAAGKEEAEDYNDKDEDEMDELHKLDDRGYSPLTLAAEKGHVSGLEELVEKRADLERGDKHGATPAILAAASGHTQVLDFLLSKNVDLMKNDTGGYLPSTAAAAMGFEAVVSWMKEKGFDLEAKDQEGRTPASIACQKGRDHVLEVLRNFGVPVTCAKTTETPEDDYDEEDAPPPRGHTQATEAAKDGNVRRLRKLAEKGVDMEAASAMKGTPATFAAGSGHIEVLAFLKEHGVDLTRFDDGGHTPASAAALMRLPKVLEWLHTFGGIDLNTRNADGRTLAELAVKRGRTSAALDVLKLLESKGVDISEADFEEL